MSGKSWLLKYVKSLGLLKSQNDIRGSKLRGRSADYVVLDDVIQEPEENAPSASPHRQSPPDDPLNGLTYHPDGDANFYTLSRPTGNWVARIQFNGELRVSEQERILEAMLGDRNVCYGDGYHDGLVDAWRDQPDITQLVEALELISDTDPDEGTAWFHEIANRALSAYREGGE